jgi:transposase
MSKSEQTFCPCGVEVSADVLVVDLDGHGQREFTNRAAGHGELVHWLRSVRSEVRVCLEATGLYGLDVALALDDAGIAVMVANPRSVRHFAQAAMQRSKTDQRDAGVLREFTRRMEFDPWRRPSTAALHLLAVARRFRAVVEMQTAEKNRLHAAGVSRALPVMLQREVQRSIARLERDRARLLCMARKLVQQDAELARRHTLLLSTPGIAEISALQLLAELHSFGSDATARQWVAYAGLDPREHTSGSSVARKPRISRKGNSNLRRALYMPAVVATQREPHLRAFYERLLARGKAKRQAQVAVMRKLLCAIFGMFKHNQPYDGSKLFSVHQEQEVVCV